jgi:hypothetical protein
MTLNRALFLVVLAALAVLVVGMLVLAVGSPDGAGGLGALVVTLLGAGVVVVVIRLARELIRRR